MSKSKLLPVEVITDILCRLPVKSLLRFRCISKTWCYLIDSPYFIKLNYNHSLKTNTNLSLILSDDNHFFSVDLDTLNTAIKLNNPIDDDVYALVVGSCNGLVALFSPDNDLALWNPSTRKHQKLPATPIEFEDGFMDYGFGYDPVSDDYKLVRIEQELEESHVKIYSLKLNSWKRTRDFHYYLWSSLPLNGILVNNALHWVVSGKPRDPANLIVAFDLRVDEFFEVPQPDYMNNNGYMNLYVESLGGFLSVVCDYDNLGVDIWVMKEYGVKESWIKLFSIVRDVIVRLLAYSKSGDRVLLHQYGGDDGENFVWYDLTRKRIEEVRIQGAPKSYEVDMCLASLVPPNGGLQAGGN